MREIINLSRKELNTPIYRIIDFDRLIEMISDGNWLTKPSCWDDPFENLLSLAVLHGEITFRESHALNFNEYSYAQCWSFSEENDLLWKVYSPNKDGVRLKSTPKKLLQSLKVSRILERIRSEPEVEEIEILDNDGSISEVVERPEDINIFIGKVNYWSIAKIREYLAPININSSLEEIVKSIFIKREPFRNEEEVRLGVYYDDLTPVEMLFFHNDRFYYDIDINQLVDEIVFDPRISKTKFNGLKNIVIEMGFKNPILRSSIYDKV